jgi:hypothetical protein
MNIILATTGNRVHSTRRMHWQENKEMKVNTNEQMTRQKNPFVVQENII